MIIQGLKAERILDHAHILGWHLELVLPECEETAKGNVRVGNVVLTSGQKLEVVTALQNGTVIRRNVEARNKGISSLLDNYRKGAL